MERRRSCDCHVILQGDAYRSLISFCESSPELENELEIRRKELEDIIDHHPEANQPIKLEDSQEAMPLNSQELKEELVLSSSGDKGLSY